MKLKLILTFGFVLFTVFAQANVSPLPLKMKFSPAKGSNSRLMTDFDLNWNVPENYPAWTFRLVNMSTYAEHFFSTDGVNATGVLGYIPAGRYLIEFYSNYWLGPGQYFEYYSCWGANYLGGSHFIAAYEVDFTDTCNELSVTL